MAECQMLSFCRQIATAMKHADVRDNPDDRVRLSVESATDVYLDEKGTPHLAPGAGIFVFFEDKPMLASEVFREAHRYWVTFLDLFGIDN
jgi:hypothetical protein